MLIFKIKYYPFTISNSVYKEVFSIEFSNADFAISFAKKIIDIIYGTDFSYSEKELRRHYFLSSSELFITRRYSTILTKKIE